MEMINTLTHEQKLEDHVLKDMINIIYEWYNKCIDRRGHMSVRILETGNTQTKLLVVDHNEDRFKQFSVWYAKCLAAFAEEIYYLYV